MIKNTLLKTLRKFGFNLVKLPPKNVQIDCLITIQQLLKFHKTEHLCDIGANMGTWSKILHDYDPGLKSVTFFEPQQKYQTHLEALNLNAVQKNIFKLGLGDVETKLAIKGGSSCASFLDFDKSYTESYTGELYEEEELVDVKTLDSVYQENQLPQPDVIKIDVQGFELQVLRGGKNTIANTKFLIIEMSTVEFYKGQDTIGDVFNYLSEIGFTLIDIGYIWREDYDISKKILQFDGVFENKNLL